MAVKDLLNKLTDVFTKDEKSNIGKLFLIVDDQIQNVRSSLSKVEKWRDIENAQGKALDALGDNVGQKRGQSTDEVYRVLIRGKVARNLSDGTTNRIIKAIATSLSCDPAEISIINAHDADSPDLIEPAAIIITKVPLNALNLTGMSTSQFLQIVDSIRAGGVRVASVNLEGTFAFADGTELEEGSEFGFSDDLGEVGGTLSGIFTPQKDYKLPI